MDIYIYLRPAWHKATHTPEAPGKDCSPPGPQMDPPTIPRGQLQTANMCRSPPSAGVLVSPAGGGGCPACAVKCQHSPEVSKKAAQKSASATGAEPGGAESTPPKETLCHHFWQHFLFLFSGERSRGGLGPANPRR